VKRPKRKSRAAEAAAIIYKNRPKPVITLPPFHLKVPRERWPVFYEASIRYSGKMYIDHETMDFLREFGVALGKANKVFKRQEKSRRRTKPKPVTLILQREALLWLSQVYVRAGPDAIAPEVPSWWGKFMQRECVEFHAFAKEVVAAFEVEAKKSVVELLGEIPT